MDKHDEDVGYLPLDHEWDTVTECCRKCKMPYSGYVNFFLLCGGEPDSASEVQK